MYIKTYPLYGLEKTVTIPIVRRAILDLIYVFNISPDALVENKLTSTDEVNKHYSLSRHSRRYTDLATTKVTMDYKEEMTGVDMTTVKIIGNNRKPILEYKDNFKVTPLSIPTKLLITMKLESKNESEVSRAINNFRFLWASGSTVLQHSAIIRYYPDAKIFGFLSSLHKQMNAKFNKEIDIETFISLFKNDSLKVARPVTGDWSKASLIVEEKLTNMQGVMNSLENVEMSYDKDRGLYSMEIEYELSYDKPSFLNMTYEPVIHNVVLEDRYLDQSNKITDNQFNVITDYYVKGDMPNVLDIIGRMVDNKNFITVPDFDAFKEPSTMGTTVLSVLVVLDSLELFNIHSIGDVHINPLFIDLMMRDKDYIFDPFSSILFVELQENDVTVLNRLSLRDDGMIMIDSFDPAKRYRVLLNVNTNSKMLPQRADGSLKESISLLKNRRVFTNNNAIDTLLLAGLSQDAVDLVKELISPIDSIENLSLINRDRKLTLLDDDIDSLVRKLTTASSYLNNVPITSTGITNELEVIDKLSIMYILDGFEVPQLTSSILENNVMIISGSNNINESIEIVKTDKISIIEVIHNDKKVRIINNLSLSLIVYDNGIYMYKDNKITSLTNISRFTDLFMGYLTSDVATRDIALQKTVMISSIIALGMNELPNYEYI